MVEDGFEDASLVLIGHGSTLNAGSSASLYQHLDELRKRRIFAAVVEAFVQQEPSVAGALRRVFTPRVFVVPYFISEGWFTDHVVPVQLGLRDPQSREFARVQKPSHQVIFYCSPVGSHPAMTDVLRARATDVVRRHPFPRAPRAAELGLLIAGHGTTYNPGSHAAIAQQVEAFRQSGEYAEVHGVFLEEPPFITEAWRIASSNNLVMVPFFLSDGLHSREHIPVMLGEDESTVRQRLAAGLPPWRNPTQRHGKRLWYADPIGTEPLLADVILERARQAARVNAGPQ
jgi:sirohydrochlorin cobaltochelatase